MNAAVPYFLYWRRVKGNVVHLHPRRFLTAANNKVFQNLSLVSPQSPSEESHNASQSFVSHKINSYHFHLCKSISYDCSRDTGIASTRRNFTSTTAKKNIDVRTNVDRSKISGPHGTYQTEYDRSISDPESFWYEASQSLHWFLPPDPERILTAHTLDSHHFSRDSQQQQQQQHQHKFYSWFQGGTTNMCHNCLDVHVQNGRGEQTALIYDSPITNQQQPISYTYTELLHQVSKLSHTLQTHFRVERGDVVVIYMPMIPQAIIAMLACARIGAVHSVVFGGFASGELAARIGDCYPKVVISANGGVESGGRVVPYKPLLDRALDMVISSDDVDNGWRKQEDSDDSTGGTTGDMIRRNPPKDIKCIVVRREVVNDGECTMIPGRDYCYDEFMSSQNDVEELVQPAIPLPSTHPHYILYTSGTTGKPKGVLRDTGSYATALKYSMSAFYDTNPGDVFWAASDIGWVVGHSYIVYGPLLQGCTTVLYEGKPVGTPDAGAFWRVVEEHGVKTLFTAPTAFRAIKQADPNGSLIERYNLTNFKALFLAGERSDPDTLHWCERTLKRYNVSVVDHWWQTELGWPGIGNAIGLGSISPKYGACAAPVPGYDLSVFNDDGSPTPAGTLGNMVIRLPLPPGTLPTLYQNDERYVDEYLTKYPGYYNTGDAAIIDEEGYVHVMARTDDIINTAGHRLSTGAMEEILLDHPDVADCAVIGVKDELKGHVPVGFVTTIAGFGASGGDDNNDQLREEKEVKLCQELVERVRDALGPVASFKKVAVVAALPKTRSGKILRGTMAKIANGDDYVITPTIDDASIFDTLAPVIMKLVK